MAAEESPLRGYRHLLRAMRSRNYRLFFAGQSISLIGTWMQRVTVPWLVYHVTGSAALLGVVGFIGQIPALFLGPLAGVVADRSDRRRILIVTQAFAALQAVTFATLVFTDAVSIWWIIALAVVLGSVNAFDMPTRQSFVIRMVDRKEDLSNAIALNSSMVHGGRLIGASAAGLLIAWVGAGWCFLLNGFSYLAVIASLLMMRVTPQPKRLVSRPVWHDLREGWNYAIGFPPIRAIVTLLFTMSLAGMSYMVLMPIFAKDVFHGDAPEQGFLIGAAGVGALGGALYLAGRRTVVGLDRVIVIAGYLFGCALIALGFAPRLWMALLVMPVVGFGMMVQMASSNTLLQTLADEDKRGRVMSLHTMALMGTLPFGSLMAGGLASQIGAPATVRVMGCCCLVAISLFARQLPRFRTLARPIYTQLGILPEVAPVAPPVE